MLLGHSMGVLMGCSLLCAQPKVTIAPSPDPKVVIIPIDQSGSAEAEAMFSGQFASLASTSFFISNQTGQPIWAIYVRCIAKNSAGWSPTAFVMLDSFAHPNPRPVLQPGSRVLIIAPGKSISENSLVHVSGTPLATILAQGALGWFKNLSPITVDISIDSIIFGNGEVEGPDTENFIEELPNRKLAADSVLAAINAGDSAQLSAMAAQTVKTDDGHFSQYQRLFANNYVQSAASARDGFVKILQWLQPVPLLFRAPSAPAN
jgi:hypothetical protein